MMQGFEGRSSNAHAYRLAQVRAMLEHAREKLGRAPKMSDLDAMTARGDFASISDADGEVRPQPRHFRD